MQLVQITFHFEFWERIEEILSRQDVPHFIHYPSMHGKDSEGRHYGTQVFPGSISVVQVRLEDDRVDDLLDELRRFREERDAHRHLDAIVLPVARTLQAPEVRRGD